MIAETAKKPRKIYSVRHIQEATNIPSRLITESQQKRNKQRCYEIAQLAVTRPVSYSYAVHTRELLQAKGISPFGYLLRHLPSERGGWYIAAKKNRSASVERSAQKYGSGDRNQLANQREMGNQRTPNNCYVSIDLKSDRIDDNVVYQSTNAVEILYDCNGWQSSNRRDGSTTQ